MADVPNVPWRRVGTALALFAALGFVFSVQYVPHLSTFEDPPPEDEPGLYRLGHAWFNYLEGDREAFPWSIHVDEHLHASIISQVQQEDRLIAGDPYQEDLGDYSPFTGLKGAIHERGYHILIAQAEELTGLSTLRFYQFLPALWTTFLAFGVWALVRPHPAAAPAAFFVGLIPTTARFLGTGFLVPIGFSLAWIPATAILTEPAKKRAGAAFLALMVTTWAFFVHLIAGFACVAIFAATALFSTRENRSTVVKLLLVALIPVAWLFRAFWGGVQGAIEREQRLPIDFTVFDNFGLVTMFIWVAGVSLLVLDPPDEETAGPAALAFGSLSLVSLGMIIATVFFDLNRYAMYSRMHPIFFLTATVPVAYAVTMLGAYTKNALERGASKLAGRASPNRATRAAAIALGVAVAIVPTAIASSQAVDHHLDQGVYRVMNDQSWSRFTRIQALHAGPDAPYEVFLSHPWRAPFLFEMTDQIPHAVMRPGSPPENGVDWDRYLAQGHDPGFYISNDITLVVGPRPPSGGIWTSGGQDIWLMEERYAEQIQRIRDGKSLQLDEV